MMRQRVSDSTLANFLTFHDLILLGEKAHERRMQLHPDPEVTYIHDTNPNYTNICITGCRFCSFKRNPRDNDAYHYSPDEIVKRIKPYVDAGVQRILMQGGHNPSLSLDYYLTVISKLKTAYPGLELHLFSAPEIDAMARFSKLSAREILEEFYRQGLRTLPGGGAELLSDRIRHRISPAKLAAKEWLDIHRIAHRIGYKTTATMMFGHVEDVEDVVEHFYQLRTLQDETGGFIAFIPWSFKEAHSVLETWNLSSPFRTPLAYLRIVASARLYLDNFAHIQSSWFSENRRLGQLGLHFGADDFGGTLMEENVLRKADHYGRTSIEEIEALIREAGFTPKRRKTIY